MNCPFTDEPCDKPRILSVVKIIDGKKTSVSACRDCAVKYGLKDELFKLIDAVGFELPPVESEKPGSECVCGMTLFNFTKNGRLGCPKCYEAFSDFIMPFLQKHCKKTIHVGRRPLKKDNKKTILLLEQKMKAAVLEERYEEAAKIRDEIRRMKNV
jgi:protein arginine kinase activator